MFGRKSTITKIFIWNEVVQRFYLFLTPNYSISNKIKYVHLILKKLNITYLEVRGNTKPILLIFSSRIQHYQIRSLNIHSGIDTEVFIVSVCCLEKFIALKIRIEVPHPGCTICTKFYSNIFIDVFFVCGKLNESVGI